MDNLTSAFDAFFERCVQQTKNKTKEQQEHLESILLGFEGVRRMEAGLPFFADSDLSEKSFESLLKRKTRK